MDATPRSGHSSASTQPPAAVTQSPAPPTSTNTAPPASAPPQATTKHARPPQPPRPFLNPPTLTSAEKSLFPNAMPIRQPGLPHQPSPLPGIHSFAKSGQPVASTHTGSPAARPLGQTGYAGTAAGRSGGGEHSFALPFSLARASNEHAAHSPYPTNLPSLTSSTSPLNTTPTPPVIPGANSAPAGAAKSPSLPPATAGSPAAPSSNPQQPSQPPRPPPSLPSQPGSQHPNRMSVSSILSGPSRSHPAHPAAYPAPPSAGATPQPPVLPLAIDGKASSAVGAASPAVIRPPANVSAPLPGFVQGGTKPPTAPASAQPSPAPSTLTPEGGQQARQNGTATVAPSPSNAQRSGPPAATTAETPRHAAPSSSTSSSTPSSYPPLPSAFARESPYSATPTASHPQSHPQAQTASQPHQPHQSLSGTPNAHLPPSSSTGSTVPVPVNAATAQTIKNSFFPSLSAGPNRPAMPGKAPTVPGTSIPSAGTAPSASVGAGSGETRYPWQQSHLQAGYPGAGTGSSASTTSQTGQATQPKQQQVQRPPAMTVASAPAGSTTLGGAAGGANLVQAQGPGASLGAGQKVAQGAGGVATNAAAPGARFSSLFADGPFGSHAQAARQAQQVQQQQALPPPPQQQQQHSHPNGATGLGVTGSGLGGAPVGQKRRRSDVEQMAAAQQQHLHSHPHAHAHPHHHHHPQQQQQSPQQSQQQRSKLAISSRSSYPRPISPPPAVPLRPPPPPPFTYAEARKAVIHPPCVEIRNEAVDAVMRKLEGVGAGEEERPRKYLGRVVYDPHVDPAKLLDGDLLMSNLGGYIEVVVPTSWILGPLPPSSTSTSPTHSISMSFGLPSSYTGAPLPHTSEPTPLSLPPHLTDLPNLRKRKVWGTDVYTDDSDVLGVLLHTGWLRVAKVERGFAAGTKGAGAEAIRRARLPGTPYSPSSSSSIAAGEYKVPKALRVRLGIVPPLIRYEGLERGGVRSRAWGNGHEGASLRVEAVEGVEHIPPPLSSRTRNSSTAAYSRDLVSFFHLPPYPSPPSSHFASLYDPPLLRVHGSPSVTETGIDGEEEEERRAERPVKRYRFAPEKKEHDEMVTMADGFYDKVVEVTDTFLFDVRKGCGRFVGLEEEEEEKYQVRRTEIEGDAMVA
ncbi:hypothetical protein JCM11641_004837 [Rhodosporidiobolus odoratus]